MLGSFMAELGPKHIQCLERLAGAGFAIVAFPMYASAIGVRKENCAALLEPLPDGRFHLVGSPCYLVEGNLSVRVRDARGEWFVWKSKRVEATSERLSEVERFTGEIMASLSSA